MFSHWKSPKWDSQITPNQRSLRFWRSGQNEEGGGYVVTKNDITQNNVGFSYSSYNTQKLNVNTGTKIDNNSSISFSASANSSDTYRDAADYENQNFVVNYKNKIKDTLVNLDLFSSFKEQELPGPRVKGGAVYNYHYCNRYENSKTANKNVLIK